MGISQARRLNRVPSGAASTSDTDADTGVLDFPKFWRQFNAGPDEQWQVNAIKRVVTLTKLEPNWDGYHAPRVSLDTGMFVLRVLQDVMLPRTPMPQIVPSSVGGIQVEWHVGGIDLEIHITAPYQGDLWFEDHRKGTIEEGEISEDISQLQRLLRVLNSR